MLFSRFISLLVVFSIVCGSVFAQLPLKKSASEKENPASEIEKNAIELLEQVISETAALKLPENRALIYATTGEAFWTRDEKRARSLFRAAGGEILQVVNTKTEKSDSRSIEIDRPDVFKRRQAEILYLRQMILLALAQRDAEMALEILQLSRPPEVAAEMQAYLMPAAAPNSAAKQESTPGAPRNFIVEQEIRLERSLIIRAAEQDPAKAAQRIRANLEKGFSMEIIRAMQRIYKKDAELASKLFDETIQKLLAADLSKPQANMNFAVSLISLDAFPPKENPDVKSRSRLTMDEKSARDIANKIADTFMKATTPSQLSALDNAMPVLQKLVPER
ncbi:MAG TPA: hypothetical protein VGB00_01720, partial [Pyrinomonadaceae bacterium]